MIARTRNRPVKARARKRSAFTLIETAMAVIIIGVGIVAMVDAQRAFMVSNAWSSQAATASFLANEIREYTRRLPRHDLVTGLSLNGSTLVGWGPEPGETTYLDYDDIDDFDGVVFGSEGGDFPGPINAFGEVIAAVDLAGNPRTNDDTGEVIPMAGWSQEVLVEKVHPFNLSQVVSPNATEPPSGTFAGRGVGDYPLRVTVIVRYRAPNEVEANEVTRMTWIVP
ncbi:MAG: hypothetical protein KF866_00860 [Phycisphaeraceae bacterium]|nr:hypothetical protein [Phycisphaeraceae bacterium]MCW5755106.1 hypothetical protein [Phycisphaeraceae bacterium]